MRLSVVVLFILALVSIYTAQSDCPTCDELTDRPRAELTTLVNGDTKTLEVTAFYENLAASPSRQPIPRTVLLLELTSPTTNLNKLYRLYTDSNGKARYDFPADTVANPSACINFKVIYCPFCLPESSSCGFAACMDYSRIRDLRSVYSNIGGPGKIENAAMIPVALGSTVPSPVNPDKYLPQAAVANYCPPPPPMGATPALCLPLIIIFSLLSGALYVSGHNPFAGFNLGGARVGRHIRYQARGRGVSISALAIASAVSSVSGSVKTYKQAKKDAKAAAAKEGKVLSKSDARKAGWAGIRRQEKAAAGQRGGLFVLGGVAGKPFTLLARPREGASALKEARQLAKAQGKSFQERARITGAYMESKLGGGATLKGGVQQLVTGSSSILVPVSGGMRGSSILVSGGYFKSLVGTLFNVGKLVVLNSPVFQIIESFRYAFIPSDKYVSLMQKWLVDNKKSMEEGDKALEALMTADKKGILALLPGGGVAECRVTNVTVDKNENKILTISFKAPAGTGAGIGKLTGLKLDIVDAQLTVKLDASGKKRPEVVAATVLVMQPGTKGKALPATIALKAGPDGKPLAQMLGADNKPVTSLTDGTTLSAKAITDALMSGSYPGAKAARPSQLNGLVPALDTLVGGYLKTTESMALINQSRAYALREELWKMDIELNRGIGRSGELKKKAEELRNDFAVKSLILAGIKLPAPEQAGIKMPTEADVAVKVSAVISKSGFGSEAVRNEKGDIVAYQSVLVSQLLKDLGLPKGDKLNQLLKDLGLPEGAKGEKQLQNQFAGALQAMISGYGLNTLAELSQEKDKAQNFLLSGLGSVGVDSAEAMRMLKKSLTPAAMEKMAGRVAGEAELTLQALQKGFAPARPSTPTPDWVASFVTGELGRVDLSRLSEVGGAGVQLKDSKRDPASLFLKDLAAIELGGRVGDRMREREQLLLYSQNINYLDGFIRNKESTEKINSQIEKTRENFEAYAETALAQEAWEERQWQNQRPSAKYQQLWQEAAKEGSALDEHLTAYVVLSAKAARMERQLGEFIERGVPLPSETLQAMQGEKGARDSIKQHAEQGEYGAAITAAIKQAKSCQASGNGTAAQAYESIASDLQALAQSHPSDKKEIRESVSAIISQLNSLAGTASNPVIPLQPSPENVKRLEKEEEGWKEGIRQCVEQGQYEAGIATARDRAKYYAEHGNAVGAAAYEMLAERIGFLGQQSDDLKPHVQENVLDRISAMPEAKLLLQVSALPQHEAIVQQQLAGALSYDHPETSDLKKAESLCIDQVKFWRAVGDDNNAAIWENSLQTVSALRRGVFDGDKIPSPDSPEGRRVYQAAFETIHEAGKTLAPEAANAHLEGLHQAREAAYAALGMAMHEADALLGRKSPLTKPGERAKGEGGGGEEPPEKPPSKRAKPLKGVDVAPTSPGNEGSA